MINKDIEQKLNLKNVKPTSMRMLVMEYFEGINAAVSLREVENHFDYSDMSTLYRTLKTFVEYNILHTIDDGTGKVKYAKCIEGCVCATEDLHYHFHCLTCKKNDMLDRAKYTISYFT